ncbi:MAG: hypothetical protein ACD_71C00225G0001 [uncultured bacterium (gcode 4)]|uniref:Uncharacterized protein n=1 Tax=uncultured bacterium (gcode 4) TaxID=1234023 RepID=K1YMI2_9BACT|nr:MAG: hypothetical protein ACD_71C00225G0001 [uncultured bacterium (gcode 4)]
MAEVPKNIEEQKPKEKFKLPDSIDSKNAKIAERLGFKKNDPIDSESINRQMDKKFDEMSNSVGKGNTYAQTELSTLKTEYKKILEWEGDTNKKLELCTQLMQSFDIQASQEKKEWAQRSEQNASRMKEEAQKNQKDIVQTYEEKLMKMKEVWEKLKELLAETKKQEDIRQEQQKSREVASVSWDMEKLSGWPGDFPKTSA